MSFKEVESCLWPCRNVSGLHILFGPQHVENSTKMGPEESKAILTTVNTMADYVVLDAPVSLSETNRAVIGDADVLVLTVERDPVCVQAAKRIIESIHGVTAVSIGVVVVNRTALVSPIPMTYIESELPVPIFGVLPPAPDLCAVAQKARVPVVKFDSDSLLAGSLRDLLDVVLGYTPMYQRRLAAH